MPLGGGAYKKARDAARMGDAHRRVTVDADHRGAGVPARRRSSHIYCCSNAFTACQANCHSLATSRIGEPRQRHPTEERKRWV